jgi:hypothetical protein
MATIEIKHVGPLADTGKIELKSVNLFIGRQSTGKSTLMKILCHCRWVEKDIMVNSGDVQIAEYDNRFVEELKLFHRFNDGYFSADSEIDYQGECVAIHFKGNTQIELRADFEEKRYVTKLSFIPSERNFLYAVKGIDKFYRSTEWDLLFNYFFEWNEAKTRYTASAPKSLVVAPNMEYYFDPQKETDMIRFKDRNYEVAPFYTSSGIQSALPVEIMVDYLGHIAGSTVPMTYNMMKQLLKRTAESEQTKVVPQNGITLAHYESAQLFIEEPEQNLYPESQWNLVQNIVFTIKAASARTTHPSMVTFTTHSPYILTALNVLMLAALAYEKDPEATSRIIPEAYILPVGSIGAYYITEEGTLQNIVDEELNMVSGLQLDSVSDKVDNSIASLNSIIYG